MTNVDTVLLLVEWDGNATCPVCLAHRGAHQSGCEMDLALAERAFATQDDRDAARKRLITGSGPTLPPPAGTT